MSTTSEKLSYLNETKGKIKRAINNFGGKLTNDSTFRSYPDELYNAWDNIFNQLPHVEDTSTSPSLSSTLEAPMRNNLKGNTSQTQYSGKNLLPPTIATETKNGITLTNNGDGSYTLTGTYSTSTTFDMALPATLNGTYSFSGNNPTAGKNIQFRILASSGSSLSTYLNNVNKTVENKTIENGTKQSIRIVGSFTSGFTFKPQLESGSTATSYEPYVGGVATPNPTSPTDVNVVSGDNSIVVCGKNLFDVTSFENQLVSGKILNDSGNEVSDASSTYSKYKVFLKANTEYRLDGWWQRIYYYDTNGILKSRSASISGGVNRSYTPTVDEYIGFQIYNSQWSEYKGQEQIEIGSSSSNYEPYIGNTYNIDLPVENLFDKSTAVLNKMITGSGGLIDFTGVFSSDYIKVQPSTAYYVNEYMPTVVAFDENKNVIGYIRNASGSATFTTPNNCEYIRARMFDASIDMTTALNNAMLEKGSKANKFTPYGTTPIELCKIGNYQDYFYKDSDKWYLHKEIGKVVFTGTESEDWVVRTSTSANYWKVRNATAFPTNVKERLQLICDYFVPNGGANDASYSGNAICGNINEYAKWVHISIDNTIANSVASFKTWLSTHNVSVYYIEAAPTNTQITYQPLIDQLNVLLEAMAKKGQTNISQINNDLPFIINATALLDANTYIMQLEAELEASS